MAGDRGPASSAHSGPATGTREATRRGRLATVATLRRGREQRLLAGHPWVYATEIARMEPEPEPGAIVEVRAANGRPVGWGYVNPRSMIPIRLLTTTPEPIDAAFFRRRIESAARYRERVVAGATAYRLVYGEADRLPGLIVDRYGDVLVAQFLTLGMDVRRAWIVEALAETLSPRAIYLRNDAPSRRLEGLPPERGFAWGEAPPSFEVAEWDVRVRVDLEGSQKTGLFLDQRENRHAIRRFAAGAAVLDAFCYAGGFGLHAARAGARSVLAIDISDAAVAAVGENARLNGVEGIIGARQGNAFDELRGLVRARAAFDLVILDPPAFVRRKDALDGAIAGYKEINLRALRLLRPGGILVTCSCSYHVDEALFEAVVADTARDAKRHLRLVERRGAAADHPVDPAIPETRYLKCLIAEVT